MRSIQLFPSSDSTHPTQLERQAQFLARREWALIYQLGHLLAALSKGLFCKLGYGHFEAFLKEVLGIGTSQARRWIELAGGLDRFPIMRSRFAAGRLCPSKLEFLLRVLKKRPEEEAERVEQAERLGVRALRHACRADLEDEPDLVYVSYEFTAEQVLVWRKVREGARAHLQANVPRGEILEYCVADFLSGQERIPYEEVLLPPRSERIYPLSPSTILPVEMTKPELPDSPIGLQQAALSLLRERHEVALRQGQLLVDLVVSKQKRAPVGQFAESHLGICRSTAYKRMTLAEGCRRHPGLERLSSERALALLPLLDREVAAHEWIEFASLINLQELGRWVRVVRWQHTFCFVEFVQWTWRAPNPGERPPEPHELGLLPTLPNQPLAGALAMTGRSAIQVLEIRHPEVALDQVLRPVQVLANRPRPRPADEPRSRIGWMIPRDFYPLLAEGIDLSLTGLFGDPGEALVKIFLEFHQHYCLHHGGGVRGKVRRRDRHCCQAPGCTGRGRLHVHHIRFRSRGGSHEAWNQVLVCEACHRLIHVEGTLKVYGLAPDRLIWIRPYERWEKGRRVKLREPAVA